VFVALVIQHAFRMRRIVLSPEACLAVQHFPRYLINCTIFEKKKKKRLLNTYCVSWFCLQLLLETFPILKRIDWDRANVYIISLHVKYPSFLSDFNESWISSTDFLKILKCKISWKPLQWEPSCSMRTDGQTDGHDEVSSRFSQFYVCAKNGFPVLNTCWNVESNTSKVYNSSYMWSLCYSPWAPN
jgi:hypothetical protein